MAEWSNAVDSKSIVLITGTGSSNLPLSANKKAPFGGVFFVGKKDRIRTHEKGVRLQAKGGRKDAGRLKPMSAVNAAKQVISLSPLTKMHPFKGVFLLLYSEYKKSFSIKKSSSVA